MKKTDIPEELSNYLEHGKPLAALNGLRGWAITSVVFFHCAFSGPRFFPSFSTFIENIGWSGVDLFFVLSGFLITNILIKTKEEKHFFRNFYARRILRIFPLYYSFLIFQIIYYGELEGAFYHLFYLTNFYLTTVPVIPPHTPAWLTWSLSIEEQFYVLWPFLIYFCNRKKMILLSLFFIFGALTFRFLNYFNHVQPYISYVSTHTRIDTISLGALVAILMQNKNNFYWLKRAAQILLFLLPIGIYFIWDQNNIFYYVQSPHTATFGFSFLALFFASLLIVCTLFQSKLADLLLKNKLIVLVGKHSYCMYLTHNEIILFISELYVKSPFAQNLYNQSPQQAMVLFNIIIFVVTLFLSILIWHLLEKHFLKLKTFFPTQQQKCN